MLHIRTAMRSYLGKLFCQKWHFGSQKWETIQPNLYKWTVHKIKILGSLNSSLNLQYLTELLMCGQGQGHGYLCVDTHRVPAEYFRKTLFRIQYLSETKYFWNDNKTTMLASLIINMIFHFNDGLFRKREQLPSALLCCSCSFLPPPPVPALGFNWVIN